VSNTDIDADFDPFEHDPLTRKANGKKARGSNGGGRGVAWTALLLALAAVVWNGYRWWGEQSSGVEEQGRQLAVERLQEMQAGIADSIRALESRLSEAERQDDAVALEALRAEIGALQSRVSELGLASSDARALLDAVQAVVEGLERRVAGAEASFAALAARTDSPGKRMDLAEIDYLLRLASERLALFGDARSAEHALEMADSQLAALDDPLYHPVRRRVAEARRAVAEFPQPDVVDVSGRVAALQAQIPELPFPGELPVQEVADQGGSGTGIWQRLKNALKPLVKVRRRVNPEQELTLEDKDYLRQGLWLQLESARLALMRNDATGWNLALQRAEDSLRGRFAAGAPAVSAALGEIGRLRGVEIAAETPDISAPWRQLRLLRAGGEQGEAVPGGAPAGDDSAAAAEEGQGAGG